MSTEELDGVNYDPLKIAEKELDTGVLPISVNRPMPEKREEPLEKIKIEETKVSDATKEAAEKEGVKDIAESGEMMELSNSGEEHEDDEVVVEEKVDEEELE